MSDPSFNSVTVRQPTAGASADLLTIDSVDGADGNGAALRFINNSAGALSLALGRIGVARVDATTVRLDLAIAADPSLSSSDATPALLSLVKGTGAPRITTAAGSLLDVGGALSVTGAVTLSGSLSVTGNASLGGTLNGRNLAADGALLDAHLANTANPHNTSAAQVGALSLAGGVVTGSLSVQGAITAGGSDLYFTETTHNHTGFGSTTGFAAIENAADYGALMILGRAGTPQGRTVKLWDYLQVNGGLDVLGKLAVQGAITAGGSDLYFTETTHNHTGFGSTTGFAAIENAADYGALMILGRVGTPQGRTVKLWDYLQVNGGLDVTGNLGINTAVAQRRLHVRGNGGVLALEGGDHAYIEYYPDGFGAGRKAWLGYGSGNDNNLSLANEIPGATINLISNSGKVNVLGKLYIANNVGIGNYQPEHMPGWSGGGLICWDVLYAGALHKHSTIRVKENIEPVSDALALIGQLNPVRYDRRAAEGAEHACLGFIAEEVREVAPQCASPDDDFFAWGVNESSFHALAIAGIQELTRRLTLLERRQHRRPVGPPQHRAAQASTTILRERRDPKAPAELYATVRFRAHHATLGPIETVRTLRLPPDTPREPLLHAARERWLATLETPTERPA